jgi:hypothetical protein
MRTYQQIFFLLLSLLFTTFPQSKFNGELFREKLTTKKTDENKRFNEYGLKDLNVIQNLSSMSKTNNREMGLRNQKMGYFDEEGFNTRTKINKTLLGNGFLLIESVGQYWHSL